jgi:hypothetical protein
MELPIGLAQAVMFFNCILDVPCSNFGLDREYPEVFRGLAQPSSGKCQNSNLRYTSTVLLLSIYGSTVLCWAPTVFQFLDLFTQSLDWGSALRKDATYAQNKRTQYRHPWLEWDSKPRLQRSSERWQFMP